MVVVCRGGRQRSVPTVNEVPEYHELQTVQVIKSEPIDEQASNPVPASGSICGYSEAPEDEYVGFSAVYGTGENVDTQQAASEVVERSVIDRRLREKKPYNRGDWTSVELKGLYDGITTYGTTEDALDVIQKNYCRTKSLSEVLAKVNEIRKMNVEHAQDLINLQTNNWIRIGYRNVHPIPERIIKPEINNWEAAIHRVNRQIRSHSEHPIREGIKKSLSLAPKDAERPSLYKVTDYYRSPGYGKEQLISWQRLSEFFIGVVEHERPLPALNTLECAVALRMVDDVEEEVSRLLSDNEKAIIRGWLANIQMRNLNDFLPDAQYSCYSAVDMLLDPLHTKRWKVPESSADTEGCSKNVRTSFF